MSEIVARSALSRSVIYLLIAQGMLPPVSPIGPRARALPECFLDAWLYSRLLARAAMSSLRDVPVLLPWSPEMLALPAPRGMRMLRLSEVIVRVRLSKSSIYRAIAEGWFPAPVPLADRARRWLEHEIEEWLQSRVVNSLREINTRLRSDLPLEPPRERSRP